MTYFSFTHITYIVCVKTRFNYFLQCVEESILMQVRLHEYVAKPNLRQKLLYFIDICEHSLLFLDNYTASI